MPLRSLDENRRDGTADEEKPSVQRETELLYLVLFLKEQKRHLQAEFGGQGHGAGQKTNKTKVRKTNIMY